MEEAKKPGPKPKVTVSIVEVRKVPATGGVFLGDGQPKLVPGEKRQVEKALYEALSDECKELLKVG